jgi:hypothetical protein
MDNTVMRAHPPLVSWHRSGAERIANTPVDFSTSMA